MEDLCGTFTHEALSASLCLLPCALAGAHRGVLETPELETQGACRSVVHKWYTYCSVDLTSTARLGGLALHQKVGLWVFFFYPVLQNKN